MASKARVALGMSGGVDSSVSVEILKRAGYEVVGVTCVFQDTEISANAVADAKDVCKQLGIEHIAPDCTDLFTEKVTSTFVSDYECGLTPSPCVGCNANAKFPSLLAAAHKMGCDFVATGHYARVIRLNEGSKHERVAIMRALDDTKDQSYMLCMLKQDQLRHIIFPLGSTTKTEVRHIAADLGLSVADKPESQDVCFIDGDYRPFLKEHGAKLAPGPIVNKAGDVLGSHTGLANFTIGQRKGIGLSSAEPYYVIEKRAQDNALVVGYLHETYISKVVVESMNWQAIDVLSKPREALVKLRYKSQAVPCIITPNENGSVRVDLQSEQPTTAPGQFAVFYEGSKILGGGMIREVS